MRGMVAVLLGLWFGTAVASSVWAEPARRVVSLNPSLTAILLALDGGAVLVGVDEFSARQQPAVSELPRVGGLTNPSLEGVVALQPDLVVLVPSAEQRDFRGQLRSLGIPLLELDPLNFDQVLETIAVLGARIGREEQARARAQAIRVVADRMKDLAPGRAPVRTVLVLQRDPLFVVGSGSFVDDMLQLAGGRNLAAEAFASPYPRVSREWLLAAAPDVLLDSDHDPESAAHYWSRWPSLPAVKTGRVVSLPEGQVTLPGPYLDRALELLAAALHERSRPPAASGPGG